MTSSQRRSAAEGNPDAGPLAPEDLLWTILCDREFSIKALQLPNSPPSWGFIISEAARVGKLDIEKALALGLMPGKQLGRIKAGEPLQNRQGVLITPDQVVGPDIPGRKLAILGETYDSLAVAPALQDADAIVHCASRQEEISPGQLQTVSTVEMAGQLGKVCNASHVVLYRFPPKEEFSNSVGAPSNDMASHISAAASASHRASTISRGTFDSKDSAPGAVASSSNGSELREGLEALVEAENGGHESAGPQDESAGIGSKQGAQDHPAVSINGSAMSDLLSTSSLQEGTSRRGDAGNDGKVPQFQHGQDRLWRQKPVPGGYVGLHVEPSRRSSQGSKEIAALVEAVANKFGKQQVTITEDFDLLCVERKSAPTAS